MNIAPLRGSLCILLTLLSIGAGLNAQVTAELVIPQEHYLAGESIVVGVKITNFSGRTLKLGEDTSWLQFNVSGENNQIVSQIGEPKVKMPFDLGTAHTATRRVDIVPYFNIARPGRYTISALVTVKELGRQISTRPAFIDVLNGHRVWEQEFGYVVNPGSDKETTELRKYMLLQVTQKNLLRLYARITDPTETAIVRTFAIGGAVSFNRPEIQIDPSSRLHVLSQYASRAFNYVVITPDGDLVLRQTYEYENSSKPSLAYLEDGKLTVAGGIRRLTDSDIPPYSPEPTKPAPPTESAK